MQFWPRRAGWSETRQDHHTRPFCSTRLFTTTITASSMKLLLSGSLLLFEALSDRLVSPVNIVEKEGGVSLLPRSKFLLSAFPSKVVNIAQPVGEWFGQIPEWRSLSSTGGSFPSQLPKKRSNAIVLIGQNSTDSRLTNLTQPS